MAEMLKNSGLSTFVMNTASAVSGYSMLHNGYHICDVMVQPCTVNRVAMYELKTDNRSVVLSSESSVLIESNGVKKFATILRLAKNLTSFPNLAVAVNRDDDGLIVKDIGWEEIRSVMPIKIDDEECLELRIFGVNQAAVVDGIFVA